MSKDTVRDLMSPLVVTTKPGARLFDVLDAMLHEHHPCVIVCEEQRVVGIITERDIVRLMARFMSDGKTSDVSVAEVMSQPVVTVSEDATLFQALVIANSRQVLHLPVVDASGNLKGIVSQVSLANAHLKAYKRQREIIDQSVSERARALEEANRELQNLCMIDPLTTIGNRRAMEIDLKHTHSQSMRYKTFYSMALFDVDFFKLYNDHYGHSAGDVALRTVAQHIQSCVRQSDRLYRYGGEEILLILTETAMHGALIMVERILQSFADLRVPHEGSPLGILTLSCGIACQSTMTPYPTWQALFDHADRSLFAAKGRGKNQLAMLPPEDATDALAPRMHEDLPEQI